MRTCERKFNYHIWLHWYFMCLYFHLKNILLFWSTAMSFRTCCFRHTNLFMHCFISETIMEEQVQWWYPIHRFYLVPFSIPSVCGVSLTSVDYIIYPGCKLTLSCTRCSFVWYGIMGNSLPGSILYVICTYPRPALCTM